MGEFGRDLVAELVERFGGGMGRDLGANAINGLE